MKCFGLIIVFFLFYQGIVYAQPAYNVRMSLSNIDTTARIACYDLQLSNASQAEWILADYNFAIFYDATALLFRESELLLDRVIYDFSELHIVASTPIPPPIVLPYQDRLALLRISLNARDEGILIDTTGAWFSTARLCFDILFDDIQSPATCASFNFSNDLLSMALATPPNIVQAYITRTDRLDVIENIVEDIVPNRTRTSCFVLQENTEDLCTDAIDNNEDGLADCDDPGCGTGVLPIRVISPTCIDNMGRIEIINFGQDLIFSIDDGVSFQSDSSFIGLSPGGYNIVVVKNGVMSCAFRTPVTLTMPDCSEFGPENCMDGIDNDGDGLIDCDDPGCQPSLSQVMPINPSACPDLMDGSIMMLSLIDSVSFSIDGGTSYSREGDFDNLGIGSYTIRLLNRVTGCVGIPEQNPIVLTAGVDCPTPSEICNDGIENDGDGLIDCDDPDCAMAVNCLSTTRYYIPNAVLRNSEQNNTFGVATNFPSQVLIEQLSIYDRWGSLIHHVENRIALDDSHRWPSSADSGTHMSGVYTYAIVLNDGRERTRLTGTFTLL